MSHECLMMSTSGEKSLVEGPGDFFEFLLAITRFNGQYGNIYICLMVLFSTATFTS